MKSSVIERSIAIDGYKTSVSLEDVFWNALKEIAERQNRSPSDIIAEIDVRRRQGIFPPPSCCSCSSRCARLAHRPLVSRRSKTR